MKGLLLLNTGSPKSPKRGHVKAFIEAMLMDPMVLPLSDWKRTLLVKGLIGPFRQFASSKKYNLIWDNTANKSPLLHNMEQLAQALSQELHIPVEIGMRYLEPSIENALNRLINSNPELTDLIVLPVFPQYADSSYQTVVDEFQKIYNQSQKKLDVKIIEPYFNNEGYIDSIVASIKPYLNSKIDQYLFNYHSLPLDCVAKGHERGKPYDYVYQAKETIKLVRQKLNLPATSTKIVFSSAIGKNWIGPFLIDKVKDLAENGAENIMVISPGFASDNLETLYDIGIEARKVFLDNGGKKLVYVPCLNFNKEWVEAIKNNITRNIF